MDSKSDKDANSNVSVEAMGLGDDTNKRIDNKGCISSEGRRRDAGRENLTAQLSSPSLAEPLITLVTATSKSTHSSYHQHQHEAQSQDQETWQSESQRERESQNHIKFNSNLTVDMSASSFKDRSDVERIRRKLEYLSTSPNSPVHSISSPATTPNTANYVRTENLTINTQSQSREDPLCSHQGLYLLETPPNNDKSHRISTEIEKDTQPRSAAVSSFSSNSSLGPDDGLYRARRRDLEIISETAFDRVARSLKQQLLVYK